MRSTTPRAVLLGFLFKIRQWVTNTFISFISEKPAFLTVPRQPGVSNNLFEILEIERGITADEFEANDDPGKDHISCSGRRV